LLSEAAASPASASPATSRQPAAIKNIAAGASETRRGETELALSCRTGFTLRCRFRPQERFKPELSADSAPASGPRMVSAPSTARVVMGAAAPANMAEDEPEKPIPNPR